MSSRPFAEQTLNYLFEWCVTHDLDPDFNGCELVITLSSGTFQLNYHGVTDQIWFSSPLSGAHHFCAKDQSWVSTRNNELNLLDLVKDELS